METAVSIMRRARFFPEIRGDPLGAFPSLTVADRPYNLWLAEQVLAPVLAHWGGLDLAGKALAAAIADDVEWAGGRCRLAFQSILPPAAVLGHPALLAAMGVTANLQRSLALLGEFILDGAAPRAWGRRDFRLSRLWCGLTEYPDRTPYFPGPIAAPLHPGRLNPQRLDLRHLSNALGCPLGVVHARCDEAIAVLRHEIRRGGHFTPDDFRRL
jgi:hypothetical protein